VSKKIIPMAGMILVEDEEEKLSSGIVLAEEKDKQSQIGKVVEIGDTYDLEKGDWDRWHLTYQDFIQYRVSFSIQKDDLIIYKKYSGSEVELEGKKYRLLAFGDIIGLIK